MPVRPLLLSLILAVSLAGCSGRTDKMNDEEKEKADSLKAKVLEKADKFKDSILPNPKDSTIPEHKTN